MGKTRDAKENSKKEEAKPPPAKKQKLVEESSHGSQGTDTFLLSLESKRKDFAKDVSTFKFNKKRCRLLSENMDVASRGGGVLYWMSRDQRVQGIHFV